MYDYFFLKLSEIYSELFLVNILFVTQISEFRKLSIWVTYHTSPYLLVNAEDKLIESDRLFPLETLGLHI